MDPAFAAYTDSLQPSFAKLLALPALTDGKIPIEAACPGIYLFSEGERHLYVGRTGNIRRRYDHHCAPGSSHRSAAFAFKLAREATDRKTPSYQKGADSRDGLISDPVFLNVFKAAKARIRQMAFRWVEEQNPVRQALLEIYCTVVLNAHYNDFDNH